jgi:hypothetical protein
MTSIVVSSELACREYSLLHQIDYYSSAYLDARFKGTQSSFILRQSSHYVLALLELLQHVWHTSRDQSLAIGI